MGSNIINIHLSKGYLDLSRASLEAFRLAERQENNEWLTSAVALASSVINPAYAAVEAFVNRGLLSVWKAMQSLEAGQNLAGRYNIYEIKTFQTAHPECLVDFKSFLKTKKLYTLKGRVNMLCNFTNTPRPCDTSGKLWIEFLDYFEKYRHFFVHVDSSDEIFNAHISDVLDYQELSLAPKLVADVIAHFYTSTGQQAPSYLMKNWGSGGLKIALDGQN